MSTALCLLILEDDSYDADLEIATLEKAGYVCQWKRVETRSEFLACLDTSDYDVILADYNLPSFDGLTALKLFLERDLDPPFILVSGSLGEELAIESLKAGATDYVLKDRLSRLGPVVERALREKEEQRQRRQAEEAQRQSEEAYRLLFEHSADGIVIVANGCIVRANQAFCAIHGLPIEKAIGASPLALIHPRDRKMSAQRIQAVLSGESIFESHTYRSLRSDGSTFWAEMRSRQIEWEGEPALQSIVRDVTERVRSEEERARAEEEIRQRSRELALLNRASQALSSTLDLRQVLVTVLEEVRRLLGVVACSVWLTDPETNELVCREATGPESDVVRGWRLALGEGLVGWVAQSGKSLIVPDTRTDTRHFKNVDQQTGLKLRSVLSVPLRVKQGVIGVLQVVDSEINRFNPTDLTLIESLAATAAIAVENARLFATEQRRAAVLAHTLEQQRELDRLKSEFIQNVSHELRTPLALAGGYAELLDKGELGELQPDQREPMAIIARRVRMLTKLVDDINAILEVGAQRLRREPVDMADLVRTALADFQIAAEEHALTLAAQVVTDLPPIIGDPVHLHRVLDNLISNALKFTPAGGSITVRLGQDGANVTLEVADTGVGIPPDQLERIFDRFYQVDGSPTRRYGGTGLGLALVKGIVEAHEGTVSVQSKVDEGSIFKVTLPPG